MFIGCRKFLPVGLGLIWLWLASASAHADTVRITIDELDAAIDSLDTRDDAIERLVLEKIATQLAAADLTLQSGELLFSGSDSDLSGGSSCNRTEIRTVDYAVRLASDTRLSLVLSSLQEPMHLRLDLDADIDVSGRAKQIFGVRLGSCRELGSDSFDFTARAEASLSVELVLRLNPVLDLSLQRLVLRPEVSLLGDLSRESVRVDVDDSLLRDILESVLEDEIEDALSSREITLMVQQLEQELSGLLDAELDNGLLIVDLPDPTDEQVNRLYRLLSPQGDLSLSLGYLRTHRLELLAALILGDGDRFEALFGEAVQCEAARILQVPLPHAPLYQLDETGCRATQLPDTFDAANEDSLIAQINSQAWYADAQCQQTVDYRASSSLDFCDQVLDTQRLGNAASRVDSLGSWTLSAGTRFDIGAVPLAGSQQPFTQRVNYKSVATAMGQCELEMRIHLPEPIADGVRPTPGSWRAVIAFHGGSWQHRSSGALGIEAFATRLSHEGFVVFAPFYRLIGDSEGSQECNQATLEQVLEDASDAMSWVLQNAADYGVSGRPVVFGQSAGGHLAAVLAVESAAEIASAVLFYAPVDFADFVHQLQDGEIESESAQDILEAVLAQTLESVDSTDALIQRNTLPMRVQLDRAASPAKALPPFFLLHGKQDTVLPFRQSLRLCNALAGDSLEADLADRAEIDAEGLRQILECGSNGSQLHLLSEGEHALDLCIAEELCLAGSPASAALTRDSIEQMLLWINTVPETAVQADEDDAQGAGAGAVGTSQSGAGAASSLLFSCLCLVLCWRRAWQLPGHGLLPERLSAESIAPAITEA